MKSILVTFDDFLRYQNGVDDNKISEFIKDLKRKLDKDNSKLRVNELNFEIKRDEKYDPSSMTKKYFLIPIYPEKHVEEFLKEIMTFTVYVKA